MAVSSPHGLLLVHFIKIPMKQEHNAGTWVGHIDVEEDVRHMGSLRHLIKALDSLVTKLVDYVVFHIVIINGPGVCISKRKIKLLHPVLLLCTIGTRPSGTNPEPLAKRPGMTGRDPT